MVRSASVMASPHKGKATQASARRSKGSASRAPPPRSAVSTEARWPSGMPSRMRSWSGLSWTGSWWAATTAFRTRLRGPAIRPDGMDRP